MFGRLIGIPVAFADPYDHPSHTHDLTYSTSTCTAGTTVDPFSVIFYQHAWTSNVSSHAGHHGGWNATDGSQQYFYNHGCTAKDGQRASQSSTSGITRYHMRYDYGSDPSLGDYSLATPHRETLDFCGGSIVSHRVLASSAGGGSSGGFVLGKWDIGYNWHNWNGSYGGSPGAHNYLGSFWWGNVNPMQQCDGSYAWNDGYVDYVEIL